MNRRLFLTLVLSASLGGCFMTQNHAIKLEAETFVGTVPGFGEINVKNFKYWKAPAKAKGGEDVYEVPDVFWTGEIENGRNASKESWD